MNKEQQTAWFLIKLAAVAQCDNEHHMTNFIVDRHKGFKYRSTGTIDSAMRHENNADNIYNQMSARDKDSAEEIENWLMEVYCYGSGQLTEDAS